MKLCLVNFMYCSYGNIQIFSRCNILQLYGGYACRSNTLIGRPFNEKLRVGKKCMVQLARFQQKYSRVSVYIVVSYTTVDHATITPHEHHAAVLLVLPCGGYWVLASTLHELLVSASGVCACIASLVRPRTRACHYHWTFCLNQSIVTNTLYVVPTPAHIYCGSLAEMEANDHF